MPRGLTAIRIGFHPVEFAPLPRYEPCPVSGPRELYRQPLVCARQAAIVLLWSTLLPDASSSVPKERGHLALGEGGTPSIPGTAGTTGNAAAKYEPRLIYAKQG